MVFCRFWIFKGREMSNDKDVSSNDTPNDDTIHNEHLGVILKMMLEHLGYLPKQSKYLSEPCYHQYYKVIRVFVCLCVCVSVCVCLHNSGTAGPILLSLFF